MTSSIKGGHIRLRRRPSSIDSTATPSTKMNTRTTSTSSTSNNTTASSDVVTIATKSRGGRGRGKYVCLFFSLRNY